MKKQEKEILEEITTSGYIDRARNRAKRRKSPWNLVLIPLAFISVGTITFLLFKLVWALHIMVYPQHDGRLNEFWGEGIGMPAFISSFLLLIPLFFAAIPLGLLTTNCLAWCIPPARRTFEKESKGHKGTSFKKSMSGLWLFSKYIVPICLILSLIGALTLKELK